MENEMKYKGHEGRKDLAGEHVLGDLGQLVLLAVFLLVWILDSFVLKYSTFLSVYVSQSVRFVAALILILCSAHLARSGLRIVFGEVREQPMVIRKGVFKIVRHPVYLGSILFYLALWTTTLSLVSAVALIGIACFYDFLARYEEKLLVNKFGSNYEQYMREVPRWIPKLKSEN